MQILAWFVQSQTSHRPPAAYSWCRTFVSPLPTMGSVLTEWPLFWWLTGQERRSVNASLWVWAGEAYGALNKIQIKHNDSRGLLCVRVTWREKRGRSGKLDPSNETAKHEQMNVWICNMARVLNQEGKLRQQCYCEGQTLQALLAPMKPHHPAGILLHINGTDSWQIFQACGLC